MVKNYIINFFKNILVVDFLTLNKKAVLLFLVLMNVAIVFTTYLYTLNRGDDFLSYMTADAKDAFVSALGYGLDLTLTGLMLPLLIRSWLAYVPLALGLWNLEVPAYFLINGTIAEESDLHFYGVLAVSVVIAFLYSFLVKSLRKKYLKNTGRN
jgi:hypothetical protein